MFSFRRFGRHVTFSCSLRPYLSRQAAAPEPQFAKLVTRCSLNRTENRQDNQIPSMDDTTLEESRSLEEELSKEIQHWTPFEGTDGDSEIDQLEPYQYSPLANPERDIRLLRLFPGRFEDPIRISIFHASLADEPKPRRPPTRLTRAEMKAKLPPDWDVWETIEGHYIFCERLSDMWVRKQWACPIEGMDPSMYSVSEDNIPCFEPQYEALSYTWGAPGAGDNIIVQSELPETPSFRRLSLQSNLILALSCLRDANSARTLWIDSICINQYDEQEKGHQVHRMSVIYRGAYRVVAWLGTEKRPANQTIQLLSFLGRQVEILDDEYDCAPVEEPPNPLKVEYPLSRERLREIDDFLSNRWFERLWVVQEVRLANTRAVLQQGRDTIPFTLFQRALWYLDGDAQASEGLYFLADTAPLFRPLGFRTFYRAISMLRGNKCVDPRDKVYGALGLVPPGIAARIQPDYLRPVGDAYRDIVLSHMEYTGRLEHLEYTHQFVRKVDAPSWIPDFSSRHFRESSCGFQQHSSGLSRCETRYESPNLLHVVGKQCATVSAVSDRFSRRDGMSQAIATLKLWYSLPNREPTITNPTGVAFSDVFATMLQQGRVRERRHEGTDSFLTLGAWRNLMDRMMACPPGKSPLSITGERTSSLYIHDAFTYVNGWAFIQTYEGYVGLGPPDAKDGDLLCIFLGCASPVLIRESSPGGHFRVIGPCYVYGLHDAIGILGPFPEPWHGKLENRPGTRTRLVYHNNDTGEYTYDDPRLGSLGDWKRIEHETEHDDPEIFEYFRNKTTGEVMNSDPRMLPDALKARGVNLTTFVLG